MSTLNIKYKAIITAFILICSNSAEAFTGLEVAAYVVTSGATRSVTIPLVNIVYPIATSTMMPMYAIMQTQITPQKHKK